MYIGVLASPVRAGPVSFSIYRSERRLVPLLAPGAAAATGDALRRRSRFGAAAALSQ
jgi:hypothetical protein